MNVFFSPQRSSETRTSFFFDLENRCILVFYKKGSEKNIRENGEYILKFVEGQEEKYSIRLDYIVEDTKYLPVQFVGEHSVNADLSNSFVTLLKQYGPEEENDFSIAYPDWTAIDRNTHESQIKKGSSLNEFEKLIHIWRIQLSEVLTQTNNLCLYLKNEYLSINNSKPPFGSPISIRSFKTSILNNTILYIESIANFYSALALSINSSCQGAPPIKNGLNDTEVGKLVERKGFLSIDKKLTFSLNKINNLTGSNINLSKELSWDKFISIKKKRNSLTHAKIEDYTKHVGASLDNMISSVKITDAHLLECVETIIWINNLTDDLFNKIKIKKDFHDSSFNNLIVFSILRLVAEINEVSYGEALERNGLIDPFGFI